MCISCLSEHGMRKAEVLVNTTIQIRALVVDELKISMGFNSPYTHSGLATK